MKKALLLNIIFWVALLATNVSGFVVTGIPTIGGYSPKVVVDSNYIYIAGISGFSTWQIEKRDITTGALINGFGTNGVVDNGVNGLVMSMAIDTNYIYIAGGDDNTTWRIEKRDKITGALIVGFGTNGNLVYVPHVGENGIARDICLDANYIYLCGGGGAFPWRIEKRDIVTGALINGFGTSGGIDESLAWGQASSLSIDTNYIYIVGCDNLGGVEWRIEKRDIVTGALINGFGTSGVVESVNGGVASSVIIDSLYVYIIGDTNNKGRIEKRNITTGALINAFGSSGIVESEAVSYIGFASGSIDSSYIYVGGIHQGPGVGEWRTEKRDITTGALINGFGTNGVVQNDPSDSDSEFVGSITVDLNCIYLAGICRYPDNLQWLWRLETRDITSGNSNPNLENASVSPSSGDPNTNFLFSVKYTDIDNDLPLSGCPKLRIKKDGSEILGSPFNMSSSGVDYKNGVTYTCTSQLSVTGDYTYYFEVKDINSLDGVGSAALSQNGPHITNAPILSWTGEENYTSDGINLESGSANTAFIYRVKYSDIDGDAPLAEQPKVHILKNSSEISGSPFSMSLVSGNSLTGASYSYSASLPVSGNDYSYYFEAKDIWSGTATGVPTSTTNGPTVLGNNLGKDLDNQKSYSDDGTNTYITIPKGSLISNVTLTVKKDDSITDGLAYNFEMKDMAGNIVHEFLKPVTIIINYSITNGKITNTNILEPEAATKLALYYFDGAKWQQMASAVDTSTKTISATTSHCSLYAAKVKTSYGDKAYAYPNPFTPNGDGVNDTVGFYFDNSNSEQATITIFNKENKLVRTLTAINPIWDGKDDSGSLCRTGIYIYQLTVVGQQKRGIISLAR